MMTPIEPAASQSIESEAVAWLVRMQSDEAKAEDWVALTAWLESSPKHAEAFDRVEQLSLDVAGHADAIAAGLAASRMPRPTPSSPPRRRWILAGALAAAAAFAVVSAPALYQGYEGMPATYQTGVGEVRTLLLPDGTRVRLDAASRITVRLGWFRRRVWMSQAQASFDVAKDPRKPFIVDVGDQRIRVVGTEFNVRHFDGQVRVTVRRGIVDVSQASPGGALVARLPAGYELAHAEGGSSAVRRVAPEAAFAWEKGRLVCQDEPLSQIVADLNRRYQTPVRLSGAAAAKRFSGVLELGDEAVLVRRLAGYLSLSVRRTEHEFVLE